MSQSKPDQAVGHKYPTKKANYNQRDLLLYAVSIGKVESKFSYELDKSWQPFPTYPLVLPLKGDELSISDYNKATKIDDIPNFPKIDLRKLVHGEQYFELLKPGTLLPKTAKWNLESSLSGVWDTGKGMVLDNETYFVDENSGEKIARSISSAFVFGAGGWGGKKKPASATDFVAPPKDKEPDFVHEFKTTPEQALIYRLSGDYNPLHADPRIGKALGMGGCILHGLCSYGIAAGGVIEKVAHNDASRFKSIYARFAAPVLPGETLQTYIWLVKDPKGSNDIVVAFVTKVKERNKVVINGGTVRLLPNSNSKL